MTELNKKLIFNEYGDDDPILREMVGGNSTGIANLNSVKYQWAPKLLKIMINNHWIPEKVSLVDDRITMKELSVDELEAIKSTLSFLIALDSMQTAVIPRVSAYITAPEISAILTVQEFQELIHSMSYQYILQELFTSVQREETYNRWRNNPILLKRNRTISEKYQRFADNPTKENFKLVLAADFALEGIFFYNGFNFFYQLASRNKLANVAKEIRYIEQDEVTHVSFYSQLIREEFDLTNEADRSIITEVMLAAVDQEIEWGHEVYGDRILGVSKESTEAYVKWLANQRMKVIGLPVLYKGFSSNPYQYITGDKRENFFETKVVEYSQSTAVDGWDDF